MNKILSAVVLALMIVVIFGPFVAASYVCHRWVGPFMTGSTDPVAVAVYCRVR